jgi:hypothetical protein
MASDVRVVGSGTGVTATTPGTVIPGVVPNEKVAPVRVVEALTGALIVNVAVWLMKGLCARLPAIEPLALVYELVGPGRTYDQC